MPNFEQDPLCISLDKQIGEYAAAVRQRQIDRRQYLQKFGYHFDANIRFPYPYDDNAERRLINDIDNYLLSFNEKDRAEVNAHFLKEYQYYLATPFAKHAQELVSWAVKSHPLTDESKVAFLEYLFSSNKYNDFDKKTLYKLADYNPNENLERTNRLYARALMALGNGTTKKDADVTLIKGMLNVFADKVDEISPEAVVNYAKIYFRLADKTSELITPWFLGKLATKTPAAKSLQKETSCKNLDKDTIGSIFGAYLEHVTQNNQFNQNLADSMYLLARVAFENYNYTQQEAQNLITLVHRAADKLPLKRKQSDARKDGVNTLAVRLEYLPVNPLTGVDFDDKSFRPTKPQIAEYAGYLCKMAAYDIEKEVSTEGLMKLLQKHARQNHLDVVEATLFSEASKRNAVDKNLVLDIAKIYADSVSWTSGDCSDFNIDFSQKMTSMFKDIAANYDYNSKDVRLLSEALAEGAGGHNKYFLQMSKDVTNAYNAAYKRRYRAMQKAGKEL